MADNTTTVPVSIPDSTTNTGTNQVSNTPTSITTAPLTDTSKVTTETAKQLKKLTMKYNGKTEEVSFDPNDDEYLTRQFQLAKLGQTKSQEYAQLQKEVKTFVEELRKNPAKILANPNIGVDVKKLAAEIVQQEIANSQKTPEQLEKEKLETELKELKEAREQEKQEFQQKEFQRLTDQAIQTYDQQISEVIESSDLPKSPYVIKKMADYLMLGLQEGMDISAQDIYPLVREEIVDDIKQMFQVMPEDVIEKIIGKDVFKKLRNKKVQQVKAAQGTPTSTNPLSQVKDTGKTGKEVKKDVKKQNFKSFFGNL